MQSVIQGLDPRWSCRTENARWRSQRGGDTVGEGSFDLLAEVGSGRHTAALSLYLRLWGGRGARVLFNRVEGTERMERML